MIFCRRFISSLTHRVHTLDRIVSRRVRVPGTCISSIYLRKMPKREHKEGRGGTSMSEHNAGCGVQPNYYFTRRSYTRWYESRVALGYSFLSRYNCRVGMSRCDLTNNTARFVSPGNSSTFRYFVVLLFE